MQLLGDVGHVENRFGPFRDNVSVGARKVHGLRKTYRWLRRRFGRTRWYSYLARLKWKLVLVRLEIVQISTQDGCKVCAECIVGSEIVLDAPD
jgi:hypothetical protein